jgi:uncharacterized membrane protein YjgN (DUF898 family)
MNEATFDPMAAAGPSPAPTDKPSSSIQTLPIEFTGTGSEYFRIWIVNLLLILVTLTLYTPWARARKLRYFHGNTLVDGHPLAFHGDPKRMFRGYLLVGAMVVVYSVAGQFSPTAGLIAFLILAAVWPALLKSSLQFRLANTSWRGLRFRFTGSVRGAYEAMLPLLVPGAIFLGLASMIDPEQQEAPPAWFDWAMLSVFPLLLLVGPWLWWRFKKYQHDHYAYAGLETHFKASVGSFFGVFLKTAGVTLASMLVGGILVGVVVAIAAAVAAALGLSGSGLAGLMQNKGLVMLLLLLAVPLMALGVIAIYGVWVPYFTARMQNLVWSKTGHREFRFQSDLTFRGAFKLTFKNWLLIGLTLGLYWPFAAVAMARLKLQAMTVLTRVDPQTLINRSKTHEGEAAGDAAGDLFGVDIGL